MNSVTTMSRCISAPVGDARVAKQVELEHLYNKNQLVPRIRSEFKDCKTFNFTEYMLSKEIDPDFGYDLMTQMVLHKRTTLPTLVGILRGHFEGKHNASQLAVDMLLKAAVADLVNWDPMISMFVVAADISPDVQRELDMYQFPLPMVVPPKELSRNKDTPYMDVKDGSVILRNNHHNEDVCLDHLNRMNQYRFCINETVAHMVKNQWRNLDKAKPGETKQDFEKRKRAFEKYDRTAKQVMDQVTELGNEFYLTHKYDKRGRVYSQGYHINYQGNAWNKAVVELADKEIIS